MKIIKTDISMNVNVSSSFKVYICRALKRLGQLRRLHFL